MWCVILPRRRIRYVNINHSPPWQTDKPKMSLSRLRRCIHQNIKIFRSCASFRNVGPQTDKQFSSYQCTVNGVSDGGLRNEADIVIIGGGAIGSSVAYFLKKRDTQNLNVVVVERDPSYTKASTVLSFGGIRQQFSLPENILMSKFGSEFLQNVGEYLTVENEDLPDVQFRRQGYLFLATAEGSQTVIDNHKVQRDCGVDIQLLCKSQLEEKFPWINTEGIEIGALGYGSEGWFDPWSLLSALKRKAISLGVKYIHGEVFDFKLQNDIQNNNEDPNIECVEISMPNGEVVPIKCNMVVNAAGPSAGYVTKLITNHFNDDMLETLLPVEPRKRYLFVFHCLNGPTLPCPLVIDPTGAHFKPEGTKGMYVSGMSAPTKEEEPSVADLEVDYDWFDDKIWPYLANRIPAFEAVKVKSGWAGYYDYNTLDQNAIIGSHPIISNLYFANGFSGHGIQQATAAGRAISELILDGAFTTIDLSRFSFDRIVDNRPIFEKNIV